VNILTFWIWAFGFAILKHIGDKKDIVWLYATDKDEFSINFLKKFRRHPYFFEGVKLSEKIIFTTHYKDILPSIDVVIIAVPSQVAVNLIQEIKPHLKKWVILLNLAKGINNETFMTISEGIKKEMKKFPYHYAVLSWGMIAKELVEGVPLWADIGVIDEETWKKLKNLFEHTNLEINIVRRGIRNIELYGALKNVMSIVLGYYEGKWYASSSLGYYMCNLIVEVRAIIKLLWGEEDLEFENYSFGGDIVASCFGDSRNKLFGKLLWSGKTVEEALAFMEKEKKRAEWYETLKWLKKLLGKKKASFPLISQMIQLTLK
jgi:glycerol-3-phosphate dehydrogenase (NAD(P)+)